MEGTVSEVRYSLGHFPSGNPPSHFVLFFFYQLVSVCRLRMRLRNANLQANANIKKAAQEEVCNFS
jgi:hypothetical protein